MNIADLYNQNQFLLCSLTVNDNDYNIRNLTGKSYDIKNNNILFKPLENQSRRVQIEKFKVIFESNKYTASILINDGVDRDIYKLSVDSLVIFNETGSCVLDQTE